MTTKVNRDINDRWENGIDHHPKSCDLYDAIVTISEQNGDYSWKCGGDGDNGEDLMYALDVYFDCLDAGEEL